MEGIGPNEAPPGGTQLGYRASLVRSLGVVPGEKSSLGAAWIIVTLEAWSFVHLQVQPVHPIQANYPARPSCISSSNVNVPVSSMLWPVCPLD